MGYYEELATKNQQLEKDQQERCEHIDYTGFPCWDALNYNRFGVVVRVQCRLCHKVEVIK